MLGGELKCVEGVELGVDIGGRTVVLGGARGGGIRGAGLAVFTDLYVVSREYGV